MSSDVIRVSPDRLRFKLEDVTDLQAPVWPGDWDVTRRLPLEKTAKHRAVFQHFQDGVPWLETDLFREIYPVRFAQGQAVHGCRTIQELATQYATRADGLFADLQAHGFREELARVKVPEVYLARDGEVILGNDGNHRVAMAKLLGLPSVLVRVKTRHPEASLEGFDRVTFVPALHAGADLLPSMTTPTERQAYYDLVRAHADLGAVVELGTWLGAATVYMAAGMRDAGAGRLHSYDRFKWHASHDAKAGGPLERPMLDQVVHNLGPLGEHVQLHVGEFLQAEWSGQPIAVLVADGPKRVREVSKVLSVFGPSLITGAVIAWQDFAYFPAYDLPACFARLEAAGAVRFLHGVSPGTTAVFQLLRPILPDDVAEKRLRLSDWTALEIEQAWDHWARILPAGQIPRFMVGAALFLCDRGHVDRGGTFLWRWMKGSTVAAREEIAAKWRDMRRTRPSWIQKYQTLDEVVTTWSA